MTTIIKISNEDIYSETEIKTNKIWIDGKPIYRKVKVLNEYVASTKMGITNIDCITKMEVVVRNNQHPTGVWRTVPWLYYNGDGNWFGGFYYEVSTDLVNFQIGSNLAIFDKCIITIEYTKK